MYTSAASSSVSNSLRGYGCRDVLIQLRQPWSCRTAENLVRDSAIPPAAHTLRMQGLRTRITGKLRTGRDTKHQRPRDSARRTRNDLDHTSHPPPHLKMSSRDLQPGDSGFPATPPAISRVLTLSKSVMWPLGRPAAFFQQVNASCMSNQSRLLLPPPCPRRLLLLPLHACCLRTISACTTASASASCLARAWNVPPRAPRAVRRPWRPGRRRHIQLTHVAPVSGQEIAACNTACRKIIVVSIAGP